MNSLNYSIICEQSSFTSKREFNSEQKLPFTITINVFLKNILLLHLQCSQASINEPMNFTSITVYCIGISRTLLGQSTDTVKRISAILISRGSQPQSAGHYWDKRQPNKLLPSWSPEVLNHNQRDITGTK